MFGGSFEISPEDGDTYSVLWDSRDIRAWEAWTGKSWLDMTTPRISDLTYLAFSAARRAGRAQTWEEFDATTVTVVAKDIAAPKDRKPKKRPATQKAPGGE